MRKFIQKSGQAWNRAWSFNLLESLITEAALSWYVLENGRVRPAISMLEAGRAFDNIQTRRVEQTDVTPNISVSTVFLGLDHGRIGSGPPVVFETMVFRFDSGEECIRATTIGQARKNHWEMVEQIRKESGEDHSPK